MSKSYINWPEDDKAVRIESIQLHLCNYDHCAAAVFFMVYDNEVVDFKTIKEEIGFVYNDLEIEKSLQKLESMGFVKKTDKEGVKFYLNEEAFSEELENLCGTIGSNLAVRWALNQKGLKSSQKIVLIKMAEHSEQSWLINRTLIASYSHIAKLCELSRRTVIDAINQLVMSGLVSKKLSIDPVTNENTENEFSLNIKFEENKK